MTKKDLLDRVDTWLLMNQQHPLPAPQSAARAAIQAQFNGAWAAGELHNVVALAPGVDAAGTDAGPLLTEAIEWARGGDASKLPEIAENLRKAATALRR